MSQTIERAEIKGVIIAVSEDVEGVTVYNTSSNKGTVSNNLGEFTISITVKDVLEISALQFKKVSITITDEIIKSKLLKIYLSEQINQLEVVLLRSGLSGVLAADISDAKERQVIELNLGNIDSMEFFDDKAFDNGAIENALNATINKGMLYNGMNLIAISEMIFKPKKHVTEEAVNDEKILKLMDIYTNTFLSETYKIPLEEVQAFVAFSENNGLHSGLLKKENEFFLINFLVKQSELFLKSSDVKN